jgi:hypothetical protein
LTAHPGDAVRVHTEDDHRPAECHVELDWFLEGSVLRGTVNSVATQCRTRFIIDSPESEEDVLRIVRLAKQGCFAERMVQEATPWSPPT